MRGEASLRSFMRGHRRLWVLVLALSILALFLAVAPAPAAPVTITVPYSPIPVNTTDLDGNPATGSWADAGSWTIPLENGAASPYGSATLYAKHDASYIYFRIDGSSDVAWTSATGDHFWLGMQISPSGTSHHSSGTWEGAFFGLWDGQYYSPMPTYPPAVIETTDFGRPPTQNATNSDYGFMGVTGSSAPFAFTAEWRRPLYAGGLALVTDGSTSYHFFVTTETNSLGASGGNIFHGSITNVNVMRLASSSGGGGGGGGTSPPTVSITSPTANAVVNGVVPFAATASSSAGIAHVDFYADSTLLGSSTAPPYGVSWDTSGYANGAHTLTAKAYDPANNVGVATISVRVDHTLRSVSILSPANDSAVRGQVTINVSATGPGGVDHVDFFVDENPLGRSTGPPFISAWDTSADSEGAHVVRAMAAFTQGGALNATVTVYVDRTPALPAPGVSTGGVGTLVVTWDASPDPVVAGYVLYRSGAASGPFVQLDANPIKNTTYVDSGLVPGSTYYYEVAPVDLWGFPAPRSPAAGGVAGATSWLDPANLRWAALPAGMALVLVILAVLVRREIRKRNEIPRASEDVTIEEPGGERRP